MDLYLGTKTDSDEQVQYPSKHLTTHGLIFGMTGSSIPMARPVLPEPFRC